MPHEPLDIESILEHLASIPSAIREATSALADGDLDRQLEPGEWSVNEILAHLRASATVRGEQRIGRMLTEDEPTIRTISPRRFPGRRNFSVRRSMIPSPHMSRSGMRCWIDCVSFGQETGSAAQS
jgi:hypothetical protein